MMNDTIVLRVVSCFTTYRKSDKIKIARIRINEPLLISRRSLHGESTVNWLGPPNWEFFGRFLIIDITVTVGHENIRD